MTSSPQILMGVGIPDQAARKLGNTLRTIAGVGTAQVGAAPITVNAASLTTSGGQTAFVLPTTWEIGDNVTVWNTSATTALIYPQSGGAIDGGSTDAAVSVLQNGSLTLTKVSATSWRSVAGSVSTTPTFSSVTSTGAVAARSATATPAAASAVAAFTMGSAGIGIYWGTGAPGSTVTAAKGSLYIQTDGSTTNNRLYVNTNGSTGWTNVTTAG